MSRDLLPDMRGAYAIISSEESHRVVSSSNSGTSQRRTNGGPQLMCEICGFNGHTGDRCFKVIGYHIDFGKRNNNNNNNQGVQNFNRRFTNNNSVGSSQTTFSDDQLYKIISLIKDNSLNSNEKGVQANMAGQLHRPQVNQPSAYQAPVYQAPIPQTQRVSQLDFESYVKANDAILRNMQSQGTLPGNTVTNPKEDLQGITT
nr:ribonuclease H-like domain-containing protein [Tanacetum cinerariifolium]